MTLRSTSVWRRTGATWPAVALVALAVATLTRSAAIGVTSSLGPGPGFFPFCLGIGLLCLALPYGYGLWRSAGEAAPPSDRPAYWRPIAIVAAIAAAAVLLERIGFVPTGLMLSLIVLLIMQERRWQVLASVSLLTSFGSYVVFRDFLDVSLPASPLGLFPFLGL